MKTLLTVPHSKCINKEGHLCDIMAEISSKKISKYLKKSKITHKIILADKNRSIIDYNRKTSRNSNWRQKIRNEFINCDLVLDIHSFPNSSSSFGRTNGKIPEIVILDSYIYKNEYIDKYTSNYFGNFLLENGVICKLLPGGDNDITLEARENNIKAILIEFNENLSEDRIDLISRLIVDYFYNN